MFILSCCPSLVGNRSSLLVRAYVNIVCVLRVKKKGYNAILKQYDVPVSGVKSILNKHKKFKIV